MYRKTLPSFGVKVVDENAGIVEHVFTVFGIVDLGRDISHPGSFSKTIQERGDKVIVLDAHKHDSVLAIIGKPLEIREIGRGQLPPSVLKEYPEATGGVWARTQFLLETPEGKGAFERIKAGALHEWSYGYDVIEQDTSTVKTKDGKDVVVRNLRSIKLYEYSPVLWGMNPATITTSVKGLGAVEMDDRYRIYELDDEGVPQGVALGEYETKEAAAAALEPQDDEPDTETDPAPSTEDDAIQSKAERLARAAEVLAERKEMTMRGPVRRLGDVLQGTLHQTFTLMCDQWYIDGFYTREDRIKMSGAIGRALDIVASDVPQHIAQIELEPPPGFYMMGGDEPEEAKAGRVLSARNAAKIQGALLALIDVLEAAGVDLPGLGSDEENVEAAAKQISELLSKNSPKIEGDVVLDESKSTEDRPEGTGDAIPIPSLLHEVELELIDLEMEE